MIIAAAMHRWGQEAHGKSLHFVLSIALNLTLLKNKASENHVLTASPFGWNATGLVFLSLVHLYFFLFIEIIFHFTFEQNNS